MGYERKKLKFELFLNQYFNGFLRILLANLLFAIPSLAFFFGFFFLSIALFNSVNILFCLLAILPTYPFFAGVAMVTRNLIREDKSKSVWNLFIRGIRENFKRFLLHGVFVTAAVMISYLSVGYYISMLGQSWINYIMLFFSVIVILFLSFASYYIPLMTVTYELKLRYLYKNCLLMSYGEFKNNFFATLMMLLITSVYASIGLLLGQFLPLIAVIAILWALFLPATFSHVTGFYIYSGMVDIMTAKSTVDSDEASIKDAKPDKPDMSLRVSDVKDLDISTLKDTDDYVFFNGRMVKQSALLKLAKEAQEGAQEVEDYE